MGASACSLPRECGHRRIRPNNGTWLARVKNADYSARLRRNHLPNLQERFETAQQNVNQLPERPDNETQLKLYGLYKQATQGDASGERPSSFDFVRRAKFDAWRAVKGTSSHDAMEQYIALVDTLRS
jgi:diazepam-binding inhibitor (GABA receptor modulator, acyl-CoA-binding protein)